MRKGKILFSPEASVWIKRLQSWWSLLQFQVRKARNIGNLKQAAGRSNIVNAFQLTPEEIETRMREYKEQCKHFEIHGQVYHTNHLQRRLEVAQSKGDNQAECRILNIIQ